MVKKKYVPERGDIMYLEFTPAQGHEQSGRRPALVLSPHAYNKKTELCVVCPITTQVKGYPFEVVLIDTKKVQGAVLADQIRTVSWTERKALCVEKIEARVVEDVCAKIAALIL
jgi:mRNA interferase MazF